MRQAASTWRNHPITAKNLRRVRAMESTHCKCTFVLKMNEAPDDSSVEFDFILERFWIKQAQFDMNVFLLFGFLFEKLTRDIYKVTDLKYLFLNLRYRWKSNWISHLFGLSILRARWNTLASNISNANNLSYNSYPNLKH